MLLWLKFFKGVIKLFDTYDLKYDVIKSNVSEVVLYLKGTKKDIRRMKTQFILQFGDKFGLMEV